MQAVKHLTYLTHLILTVHVPHEVGTIFILILHTVKLRLGGVESLAQGHTLAGWQSLARVCALRVHCAPRAAHRHLEDRGLSTAASL